MDQERFDHIAKALASAGSRRRLLRGLAAGALGGLLARVAPAAAAPARVREREQAGDRNQDDTGETEAGERDAAERRRCSRLNRRCGEDKKCCNGLTCKRKRCLCKPGTKPCNGKCIPQENCCELGDCTGTGKFCPAPNTPCVCFAGIDCGGNCTAPDGDCCSDADCAGGKTCQGNVCRCPSGQKPCNGGCIPQSQCCGGCSSGKPCQNGTCQCPSGQAECGGGCCPLNEVCDNGTCRCPGNRVIVNGRCVRPCSTASDCGGCGCGTAVGSPQKICHGNPTDKPCQNSSQCSSNELCMDFLFAGRVCGQICGA